MSSAEMLPALRAGQRFRSGVDGGYARSVPLLDETEAWELEFGGVSTHDTIMTEVPDPHEERTT